MPAEQLELLFEVLEGGQQVSSGDVIQFPTDITAQSGGLSGEGITTTVQMGNGAAAEVSQLTATEAGVTTTTGVGLLAMDVGAAGTAIGAALGLVSGVAMYELNPSFWDNVTTSLINAGQTIGGKVRAFLDGDSKVAGFSAETIEIFKNAFLNAGLYDSIIDFPTYETNKTVTITSIVNPEVIVAYALTYLTGTEQTAYKTPLGQFVSQNSGKAFLIDISTYDDSKQYEGVVCTIWTASIAIGSSIYLGSTQYGNYFEIFGKNIRGNHQWGYNYRTGYTGSIPWLGDQQTGTWKRKISALNGTSVNDNVQPDATLPNQDPFQQTYPNWQPITIGNINIYPTEMPVNDPEPDQDAAQNPNPDPNPAPWLEWLINNLPVPEPNPNPQPQPVPEPDPDPQPEPEPIPDPGEDPIEPDPPDPNPDPPTPPLPIVPDIPTTVDSNAMFTVYAPSLSQLNAFGGWLWSSNIIEQILRMWQNPLDGIIALMKVYATPTTGTAVPIQVGYLQSETSAPVVTSQFATVNCGTVTVPETKKNATDYSPYVSLHLYLPFIGIVELDTDEFMNGSISVTYTIDMYTGTCLAEVKCTRNVDMPNATILYTFSGNASQQLPVTSSNFAGALSSLVSAVGAGITIASGGAVAGIAGGIALGHSLTHEMVHVGHSGSLSANAGIMASRKPYLIISRRHGYDANNYAIEYGFPANKTVYLGNCSGFTRVKACHLKIKANENEKEEIMSLLKKGVIL